MRGARYTRAVAWLGSSAACMFIARRACLGLPGKTMAVCYFGSEKVGPRFGAHPSLPLMTPEGRTARMCSARMCIWAPRSYQLSRDQYCEHVVSSFSLGRDCRPAFRDRDTRRFFSLSCPEILDDVCKTSQPSSPGIYV